MLRSAVASIAISDAVEGLPRPGELLGTSGAAWWCAFGDEVVVLTDAAAVRLPNGVVGLGGLPRPSSPAHDPDVVIGAGVVSVAGSSWKVIRWWDPRVTVTRVEASIIGEALMRARAAVPGVERDAFAMALEDADAEAVTVCAAGLLGHGQGLTPVGDDRVVGTLAGYRHVGLALGDAGAGRVLSSVRDPLLALARERTTSFSAALLRHSLDGDVAHPVGAMLRALTGRGSMSIAVMATMAIGHSSGPALASGVVAGALAAYRRTE